MKQRNVDAFSGCTLIQYTLLVTNDVMYNLTSKPGGTWRFKTLMRCIAR